jgi:uncharacterized protein YbaR (Trm112 family)
VGKRFYEMIWRALKETGMRSMRGYRYETLRRTTCFVALFLPAAALHCETIPLRSVVTPSTVFEKDGKPVTFAIHGFIEFRSLAAAFPYIRAQGERWKGKISKEEEEGLETALLREAVESRVVSMVDERPLESLVTHTSGELREAIAEVKEPVPAGYTEAFLAVQEKWKHSINCWSASPVIAARALSNWYPIEEGIPLYGANYDSTEHFWQAVKYHPGVTVGEVKELTKKLEAMDWSGWLQRLDDDPRIYLPNAYAVEFLRANLKPEKWRWFEEELSGRGLKDGDLARQAQQRTGGAFRFSAYEEKVLWGDLADTLHLIYLFSAEDDPLRKLMTDHHFDGIYLGTRKMGFISEEFRSLMLEIWKVKYLQMPRFREVIAGIPKEIRLEHFLNDGDSPDIPIAVYVGYLNRIRELAQTGE